MATSEKADAPTLHVRVALDVPGETRRQWHVFLAWFFCLTITLTLAVVRRPTIPVTQRSSQAGQDIMDAYRRNNIATVALFGLLLPALMTWLLTYRRRRGGPHAAGISVAITEGEVRVWGRGYGQRLKVDGAEVSERLVDVYTGRMGSWRQRRLKIRAKKPTPGMPTELELATLAQETDEALDLTLYGGEGDCLELARVDYLQLLQHLRGDQEMGPYRSQVAETAEAE